MKRFFSFGKHLQNTKSVYERRPDSLSTPAFHLEIFLLIDFLDYIAVIIFANKPILETQIPPKMIQIVRISISWERPE